MKTKLGGIFLFLCLAMPIATTLLLYHHHKKQIRKEVKHKIIEGLDKEKLILLKFHKKEIHKKLNWKHSKEFSLEGQMFDIVEKEILADSIHYWCWPDNKETKLNKLLQKQLAQHISKDPQNRDQQQRIVQFYLQLYCSSIPTLPIIHFQQEIVCIPYQFNYSILSSPPPVPPPELV